MNYHQISVRAARIDILMECIVELSRDQPHLTISFDVKGQIKSTGHMQSPVARREAAAYFAKELQEIHDQLLNTSGESLLKFMDGMKDPYAVVDHVWRQVKR